MEIIFSRDAEEELQFWIKTGNKDILKRITKLIEAIQKDPFKGIGKPEALKHNLKGCWLRRITKEHRLVYEVKEQDLFILSLKDHY